MRFIPIFLVAICIHRVAGFVPLSNELSLTSFARTSPFPSNANIITQEGHLALRKQRRSVAKIQTQGLFGLGAPEIAVIVVAAAFLIGPQQLGNFAGKLKEDYNDLPEELKKIPEEFQKGLEEGETSARARNAKQMEPADPPSLPENSGKS